MLFPHRQELLANNNVVIIEPIRTKIEKISDKHNNTQALSCKITGGSSSALNKSNPNDTKNGLKRHFFYHPIRVNKELLDEELPTPDTVKNARKMFEETLRLRAANMRYSNSESFALGAADIGPKITHESMRKKALRHLTIDTTYGQTTTGGVGSGGSGATKPGGSERGHEHGRWDSSSLSSGISSGELSSPCECNDHHGEQKEMFSSEENICDDELCESYYVSQVRERER